MDSSLSQKRAKLKWITLFSDVDDLLFYFNFATNFPRSNYWSNTRVEDSFRYTLQKNPAILYTLIKRLIAVFQLKRSSADIEINHSFVKMIKYGMVWKAEFSSMYFPFKRTSPCSFLHDLLFLLAQLPRFFYVIPITDVIRTECLHNMFAKALNKSAVFSGNKVWRQITKGQWERESTRQGLDATSNTKFTAMRPPYSLSPRCYSGFQRRNARVVVVFFFLAQITL